MCKNAIKKIKRLDNIRWQYTAWFRSPFCIGLFSTRNDRNTWQCCDGLETWVTLIRCRRCHLWALFLALASHLKRAIKKRRNFLKHTKWIINLFSFTNLLRSLKSFAQNTSPKAPFPINSTTWYKPPMTSSISSRSMLYVFIPLLNAICDFIE